MPKQQTLSLMVFVGDVVRLIAANQTNQAIHLLENLPTGQAMLVTAYVCDQIHGSTEYGGFLRKLENFL